MTDDLSRLRADAVKLASNLVSNYERSRGGADYGLEQKNERYEITVARALLEIAAENVRLKAERDAMRDALKPFAEAAYVYQDLDDAAHISFVRVRNKAQCLLGDLRHAAEVLRQSEGEKK